MKVIIFSWEYPPRIVGQLATYVKELANQLVKSNLQSYVVTYHDYLTGENEEPEGVRTFRVSNPVKTHIGVLTWVLTLNQEVERAAANIYYGANRQIDLVDVQDWHFIPAATTLKKGLKLPFVYSVDSLEQHRSHGANAPFNMAIKSIEMLGINESARIIVKSEWMRDEIVKVYGASKDKICIVSPRSSTWISSVTECYREAAKEVPA